MHTLASVLFSMFSSVTTRPRLSLSLLCSLSAHSFSISHFQGARLEQMFLRLGAAAQLSGALREALALTRVIHHFVHPGGEKKKRLGRASHLDERAVAGEPRVQGSAADICKVAHGQRGFKALVDGSPSCTGISPLIHSKHEADNVVAGAADVSHHARQTPSREAAPHTGRRSPLPLMRKWPVLKSIQQTNIRGQIKSGVAPSFPIPCPAPGFCLVREPTPFELAQKPSDFLRSR